MTTKIFVGNLSWHTDERTLKNVFASAGPVKFVKVIRDKSTSISKGFAFVTFKEPDAVKVAVEQFHEFVVDGKPIKVTEAEDPRKDGDKKKPEAPPAAQKGATADAAAPAAAAAPEPTAPAAEPPSSAETPDSAQ